MNSRYQAHYDALLGEGIPAKVAAKAAEVTANEDGTTPRTPEQQQAVTAAWEYLQKRASEVKTSGEQG